MALFRGGDGRVRGVSGHTRARCLRERAMLSRLVHYEVADCFGNLGEGLSGPDGVGTARGKHGECREVVQR